MLHFDIKKKLIIIKRNPFIIDILILVEYLINLFLNQLIIENLADKKYIIIE